MAEGAFENLGWIDIVFFGVVALGDGFWQLWSVNREIARDKEKAAKERGDAGSSTESQ